MHINGAELIIRLLEQQGVRLVAGIPGGTLLPLYEALGRSSVIRHVLARHEQGAGFIAHGIARITGKAGVCLATSGPGVTNLVTAIADAKLDSIPLVCITGQVPKALIGTDAFQEVATLDIVRSITKKAYFVHRAEQLPEIIADAFETAQSGRPGPVLIDIPKDVQTQEVVSDARESMQEDVSPTPVTTRVHPEPQYKIAAELIARSRRPIIYVGGGIVKARAHHLLREMIAKVQIPVTTTLMALGALPSEHPLNLGMPGMHGAIFTNKLIEECDLLLAIGARFDDRATGKAECFAPHAKIIHIDIDAREFGKIKSPALAIQDDAGHALRALCEHVQPHGAAEWMTRVAALRKQHPLATPGIERLCTPYGIVRAVSSLAPSDCIVTTDVGQHQMWVAQSFNFHDPHRWLTSGGLGTMGFGLPAAIGAALTDPCSTVVCFTGDGSLPMNIQELATLAELNLSVKLILLDNAALGLVRQQQHLFYSRSYVASLYARQTGFCDVAAAYGIRSCDLATDNNAQQTLYEILNSSGPALIRVPIESHEMVLPMVAPGKANTEALTSLET
jgi:acetolactate synthase I/II/III large subunit